MTPESPVSIYISFFSLAVAGVSLGWNIYRDCVDRGRLTVRAFIADEFIPDVGKLPAVLSVRVTNTGKQAITVDGHGFAMNDKSTLMPKDTYEDFQKKRLEPGDYLTSTLSHELLLTISESTDKLQGFFITDSQGKKWWVPHREFKNILDFLNRLPNSVDHTK